MGLLLELAILIRAGATRTVTKFPYFYAYIFCVFCVSAALDIPYLSRLGFTMNGIGQRSLRFWWRVAG